MVKRNTHLLNVPLPIMAFSFSSKGFVNLPELVANNLSRIPDAYLLSLYDYRYLLSDCLEPNNDDTRIRIWDSGGYETSKEDDLSSHFSAIRGKEHWTEELYVETANSISLSERDILVNFDSYENRSDRPVAAQMENACRLFGQIPGVYLRDVLLHVDAAADPKSVVEAVARFDGSFDIIGFTEKGVAPTWYHGIKFVSGVRAALNAELGTYIPIHLFGCFDPKSTTRFCFAGADIFDGLSWLRYFIKDGYTYYCREYEDFVHSSEHAQLGDYFIEIANHNITEIVKLRNDLSYCVSSCDFVGFEEEAAYVDRIASRVRS